MIWSSQRNFGGSTEIKIFHNLHKAWKLEIIFSYYENKTYTYVGYFLIYFISRSHSVVKPVDRMSRNPVSVVNRPDRVKKVKKIPVKRRKHWFIKDYKSFESLTTRYYTTYYNTTFYRNIYWESRNTKTIQSVQGLHFSKENYDINEGKNDITWRENVFRDMIHCLSQNQIVGEILILTIFFNIFPDWSHLDHLPRFIFLMKYLLLLYSPCGDYLHLPVLDFLSFLPFYFLKPARWEWVTAERYWYLACRITLTKMTKNG